MDSSKKDIPFRLTDEELNALVTIATNMNLTIDELLRQIMDC